MGCSSLAPLMFTQPPTEQRDCGTLEVGIDAYYKISRGHNAAVLSEQPMNQSDA
jgi:hypothetical protein